ncbi:endo-beta-N-acetylglucosaminidase [Erysipelothrix urinaevulpis]|uniref:endo-beta-N-acetylglucosaminidase n=1 Tax=Erysipelothrix urinaevulpis TaxID=2683717 RepID=UPI00135C3908|nr:glycoside hydrolase [Erysipelothrix urinaevulpis]
MDNNLLLNMKTKVKKIGISIVSLTLVFTMFMKNTTVYAAIGGDGTDTVNENYEKGLSLQPLAPAFSMKTLLDWSPEKDPDAHLNKSSIPLNKNRFQGHQINDLANPDAKITSAAISNANHDKTPSTGGEDFNIYSFDNWQYLDSMIYWASSEEGVLAIPSPDIVDAAHKNGVPVYATLHFPWGSGHYDSLEELEKMSEKDENGNYPIGDKLIEVAQYFGFDGYFFNQESFGSNEEVAKKTRDLLSYVREESRKRGYPINIGWYDAMANDGSVSHQNAVNNQNDLWLKALNNKEDYAADEFFMNFNWNKNRIKSTHDYMKNSLDRNPYDAFAGFEIQQNSYNTQINSDALLDENNQILSSIALYAPNSTMGFAANGEEFIKHEQILYTGPQKDPSLSDDSENWKGMSRFVTDKSVITGNTFSTSFNTGHGRKWFANGKEVRDRTWNYRSTQDIMPTWRWWIKDQKGTRIDVDYDFSDAYNGGTSLKFTGELEENSNNNVMLYSTNLDVSENSNLELMIKGKQNVNVEVGISFDKDYKQTDQVFFPLNIGDEWTNNKIDLSEYNGETIYAISLRVSNNQQEKINLNLGELSVYDKQEAIKNIVNGKVDEKLLHHSREASARLSWEHVKNAEKYEVYQVNDDGIEVLLGATPSTFFYADKITRTDDNAHKDDKTIIKIKTLDKFNNRSEGFEIDFDWGVSLDGSDVNNEEEPVNIALNAEVIDVSFENDAEPASKALDGTATGNSKWAATNKKSGFMTIRLEEPQQVSRWRVEHAEYGGEAQNMNTVDFSLQYKDDQGNWNIAKSITGNQLAVTDVMLDEPITAQEWKLDITNSGTSPWGAIRIYEWQMFNSGMSKTPMLNQYQIKADFEDKRIFVNNIPENSVIRVYDSLISDEVLYEVTATNTNKVMIEDVDFTNFDQRIYFTIQTGDLAESLKNSIQNYENRKTEEVYIHAYVKNMGLNATFDIIDEMGKIRHLGGTSDSGLKTKLPIGSYQLLFTSLPIGVYYDDKPVNFEVKENEINEVLINLDYYDGYEELGRRIYEANKIKLEDYTEESVENFKSTLEYSTTAYKQEATSESYYLDILEELDTAINNLVKNKDSIKEELQQLFNFAKTIDKNEYTTDSVEKLENMIEQVEEILSDSNATQEDYEKAYNNLNKSINDLEIKQEVVDKTSLKKSLMILENLDLELYDEKSNKLVQEAIEKANIIIENDEATEEEVEEMKLYLESIPSKLKLKVDKTNLMDLIKLVEKVDEENYTTDSFETFKQSLEFARGIVENPEATQSDVNTAYEKLSENYHNLIDINIPKENSVSKLKEKIQKAKLYEADKYTLESYKDLEDAILYGENVLNNLPPKLIENKEQYVLEIRSVSTEEDVQNAIKQLDLAMDNLVEKDTDDIVKPTEPEEPIDSEDQIDSKDPNDSTNPKTEDEIVLPSTGIENESYQLVIALTVALIGYIIYRKTRKEKI